MNRLDLSVIVATTKKYHPLMKDFIHFYELNFPHESLDTIIVSDSCIPFNVGYKLIVTEGGTWSSCIINGLKNINTKYTLILLDDYWVFESVEYRNIENVINVMNQLEMQYLAPLSYGDLPIEFELSSEFDLHLMKIFRVKASSKPDYILNASFFYETEFLSKILFRNESAWEFESNASLRANLRIDDFRIYRFDMNGFSLGYIPGGVIKKGKWRESATEKLKLNNYTFEWKDVNAKVNTEQTIFFERYYRAMVWRARKYLNLVIFFFKLLF
jgi:hypothetical protein